jgi:hypothetical protein
MKELQAFLFGGFEATLDRVKLLIPWRVVLKLRGGSPSMRLYS